MLASRPFTDRLRGAMGPPPPSNATKGVMLRRVGLFVSPLKIGVLEKLNLISCRPTFSSENFGQTRTPENFGGDSPDNPDWPRPLGNIPQPQKTIRGA